MKKTALITGGNRGIGRAIAQQLAQQGYGLVLCARDMRTLNDTADWCRNVGAQVVAYELDIANETEVTAAFDFVKDQLGRLDLLVNNAGIVLAKPITETSADEWDQVQQVNARGAFLCAREAMRIMQAQGSGQIINISSVVGVKGYPNQGAYGASKHALIGLTKTLIEEGREFNIRAHAICPGGVATDMVKQARPDLTDFSAMIQPEDVADAVTYLSSLPPNITVDVIHLRRAASAQTWG